MQPLSQLKTISITHSECEFVALVIQLCNAHAPYFHLGPAPFYNIFPHYTINGTIKKKVTEHKMCVLIFSTTFV